MDSDMGMTIRAAGSFALIGTAISILVATMYYVQMPPVEPLFFYMELIGLTVIFSAFAGGFWWEVLVERLNWFSSSIRGALAGLLTAWLSTTIVIIVMVISGDLNTFYVSKEGFLQELATVVLTSALISATYLGPIYTFHVGTLTGYLLGRRRPEPS